VNAFFGVRDEILAIVEARGQLDPAMSECRFGTAPPAPRRYAGRMFTFVWKKFSGSYLDLILLSRS
jgi:hypothetical protein